VRRVEGGEDLLICGEGIYMLLVAVSSRFVEIVELSSDVDGCC